MNLRLLAGSLLATALSLTASLSAQTPEQRIQQQRKAAYGAHQADFDYLLGDWEFTSESKQYGKFNRRWSAVRLDTGQILDEYRVLESKGETVDVTSTVRAYNAAADRWELVGMHPGGGLLDFGTGQRVGQEVHIEQKFGVSGGRPIILRIRYYNIQPDRFSWNADRSSDDGKTWTADFQHIEAHRIGAARSLGALTPTARPQN